MTKRKGLIGYRRKSGSNAKRVAARVVPSGAKRTRSSGYVSVGREHDGEDKIDDGNDDAEVDDDKGSDADAQAEDSDDSCWDSEPETDPNDQNTRTWNFFTRIIRKHQQQLRLTNKALDTQRQAYEDARKLINLLQEELALYTANIQTDDSEDPRVVSGVSPSPDSDS